MAIVTGSAKSVGTTLAAAESASGPSWQDAMRTAIRDPVELCRAVGLGPRWQQAAVAASQSFPVFAPRQYVARMVPGDPFDPLLRQVLPWDEELRPVAGFVTDPVGDQQAALRPGLLQKYHGRVLLVSTGSCAIHCRYCFRRHFPYQAAPKSARQWQPALNQISADRSIEEVILSGGDPLTLTDKSLTELVQSIRQIRHVRRLRIHTRLPVVIPQRITSQLLDLLSSTTTDSVMVIHANHAAELDDAVAQCIERLAGARVLLLNQAVLLRGVNDSVASLEALSRRLLEMRVIPYYLHQLDRVAGAAHFEVPIVEGRQLIQQLRRRLPGYAVPRYVLERAGEEAKHVLE